MACAGQADMEKAQIAQRAQQEAEAVERRAAAEAEAAEEEARAAECAISDKRASLPAEPPLSDPDAVTVLIRLPNGGRPSRRCTGCPRSIISAPSSLLIDSVTGTICIWESKTSLLLSAHHTPADLRKLLSFVRSRHLFEVGMDPGIS